MIKESFLTLNHVSIAYQKNTVINDCQLSLAQGKILSLLGSSGCGKSTLLKAIAGLLPISHGEITLDNTLIAKTGYQKSPKKRGVGMIFQDYALFPHLTVSENVSFGLHQLNDKHRRCLAGLSLVRLDQFADRYPHELSGGQQQRVAIARALVCKPKVLLFDEPFSNLDVAVRKTLMEDIKQLLNDHEMTAIFVTHDRNEAFAMADNIAIMRDGAIAQFGKPEMLYDHPADADIATFLGYGMVLPVSETANGWQTAIGMIDKKHQQAITFWQQDDGTNHVYLRPHQLHLSVDPAGQAIVKDYSFRGDLLIYQLQVGETTFESISQQRFNRGQRVNVKLALTSN